MRPSDRRALRELYRFCCGYCGTSEIDAGGELTVDHFWPQSAGGSDTPDNWVYSLVAQRQRSRELQRIRERLARLEEENAALRHHIQAVGEQIDLLLEQITRRR